MHRIAELLTSLLVLQQHGVVLDAPGCHDAILAEESDGRRHDESVSIFVHPPVPLRFEYKVPLFDDVLLVTKFHLDAWNVTEYSVIYSNVHCSDISYHCPQLWVVYIMSVILAIASQLDIIKFKYKVRCWQ